MLQKHYNLQFNSLMSTIVIFMNKQIISFLYIALFVFFNGIESIAQAPCGAFVPPPTHPVTAPTDSMNNYFACESGVVDIAFKQDSVPDGNLPDNLFAVEFSNEQPLIINETGTWNTVEQGLVAGDTVFITALTFNIDSVNGVLTKADGLCPFLNLIPGSNRPCSKIDEIKEGENDGTPGVQSLDEVLSIVESVGGEQITDLEEAVSALNKFNNNVKSFDVQICFARTRPPLLVHIVEEGPTCLQGDIDQDLVPNLLEDSNSNGDLTDDDQDEDGIPNYLDEDDNGDGILTKDHDVNNNGDPTDDDINENGIADYIETLPLSIVDNNILTAVYPNPGNGVFYMAVKRKINQLNVYDITGKEVEIKMEGNRVIMKQVKSGMYLLKINEQFIKVCVK